jgi:hypothetical protein
MGRHSLGISLGGHIFLYDIQGMRLKASLLSPPKRNELQNIIIDGANSANLRTRIGDLLIAFIQLRDWS